ncbi:hypothetical protein QR46_4915 [Giardia duodenalis assemblage B]|uniref:Uncharacterized protein n=1 Tax=Giardia duodenalis assemblage B TaxID=1394984 RepID=A0A132NM36_GIAIN|nr:hypothetical protein QR46_4915 [Giardia intestinalis assemblage B]
MIGTILTIAEPEVDPENRLEEVGAGDLGTAHVRLQDVDNEDVGGDRSEGPYTALDVLISDYSALPALGPFAVEQQYGRGRLITGDDSGDDTPGCLLLAIIFVEHLEARPEEVVEEGRLAGRLRPEDGDARMAKGVGAGISSAEGRVLLVVCAFTGDEGSLCSLMNRIGVPIPLVLLDSSIIFTMNNSGHRWSFRTLCEGKRSRRRCDYRWDRVMYALLNIFVLVLHFAGGSAECLE